MLPHSGERRRVLGIGLVMYRVGGHSKTGFSCTQGQGRTDAGITDAMLRHGGFVTLLQAVLILTDLLEFLDLASETRHAGWSHAMESPSEPSSRTASITRTRHAHRPYKVTADRAIRHAPFIIGGQLPPGQSTKERVRAVTAVGT